MAWEGSTRASRLPDDWQRRVAFTRDRAGGRCEWVDPKGRCRENGAECDHRVRGDDHSVLNLQWLCTYHHARKTAAEGVAARKARRDARFRGEENHPGKVIT